MKISTALTLFLVIAGFVFTIALVMNDFKDYYPSVDINISSWENEYDYYEEINESVGKIKAPLVNLADDEKSWVLRTVEGVAALPMAFVELIKVGFESVVYGGAIVTNAIRSAGVNPYIILIIGAMILVWIITKLLEAVQRWPI